MGEYTNTLQEAIAGGMIIGLEDYPIFDELYRDTLNDKIIDHYLYHEMGFEMEARFVHRINNMMNEKMPYFNKLYSSELLSIDPLLTFSRSETGSSSNEINSTGSLTGTLGRTVGTEETSTNEGATNNSNSVDNKQIESDTPQALLTIDDIDGSVYASNAKLGKQLSTETSGSSTEINVDRAENETQSTTSDNTGSSTGTSGSSTTASGYDRPLTELLQLYRSTLLNIDMMVIDSLRDCFMGVF